MHDGGDIGFEAELVLLPEQALAVTVMTNVFPAGTTAITAAVLDAALGFGVQLPRPPLLVPLMATLNDIGIDAAVNQYQRMDRDAYNPDITFFRDSVFILGEAYRSEDAIELLKLGAVIYPEIKGESSQINTFEDHLQRVQKTEHGFLEI